MALQLTFIYTELKESRSPVNPQIGSLKSEYKN